jgi:hypothetical protein
MKAIREMAADFSLQSLSGTSLRHKHNLNGALDVTMGIRKGSISKQASRQLSRENSFKDPIVVNIIDSILPTDLCYIDIQDMQVKGIISGSILGLINPYIAFTCLGQRIKTKVQWDKKGLITWENDVISLKANKNRLGQTSIQVEVFDKERIRRKKLVGELTIKMSGLEMHSIDSWFALNSITPTKNCEVHLNISLRYSD